MLPSQMKPYTFIINKKGTEMGGRRKNFYTRPGIYTEIKSLDFQFQFNLRGGIKSIRGLSREWPHPFEFLKRTEGNDWIFYTVGNDSSDNGIVSWFGEYYLPCLPYPSNSIWDYNPFGDTNVMMALSSWSQLYADLYTMQHQPLPSKTKRAIRVILENDESTLFKKSQEMISILGERVSVLPPDSRHVEYETIPLIIADGCMYHCDFCSVKSGKGYRVRSKREINEQIQMLKSYYSQDLVNYNSIFLGNHDALGAGSDIIKFALNEGLNEFGFKTNLMNPPIIFMFGSVDSFLRVNNNLLDELESMPIYTYINIGLESVDDTTLRYIRKPLEPVKIREAFKKMLYINSNYKNIEISANFLLDEKLPTGHHQTLCELLSDVKENCSSKGAIYLSPLMDCMHSKENILELFNSIKKISRLSTYIYLIQRI